VPLPGFLICGAGNVELDAPLLRSCSTVIMGFIHVSPASPGRGAAAPATVPV
jgi:hypothetical protein